MRVKEILLDVLINTKLFEMANDRATVVSQTHNLTPTVISHLAKCLMFGKECRSYHHWCSEINAALRKIQLNKLKGTNKPLNREKLYNIMFNGPLGHTQSADEWMSMVWDEKGPDGEYEYRSLPIVQHSGVIIHKEIERIIDQVTYDISNTSFKDISLYL